MGILRGYIAASADGFIATSDGGVGWLDPFNEEDFGYAEFEAHIGTLVMGRKTFEQVLTFGKWPYAGKKVVVLSSRKVPSLPEGAVARRGGLPGLVAELREAKQDAWVVGGAKTLAEFLKLGAVSRLELFVIPVLLGDGVPLFERRSARAEKLTLDEVRQYPNGVVKLGYRLGEPARAPAARPAPAKARTVKR